MQVRGWEVLGDVAVKVVGGRGGLARPAVESNERDRSEVLLVHLPIAACFVGEAEELGPPACACLVSSLTALVEHDGGADG